jgi:hypothetical protein
MYITYWWHVDVKIRIYDTPVFFLASGILIENTDREGTNVSQGVPNRTRKD